MSAEAFVLTHRDPDPWHVFAVVVTALLGCALLILGGCSRPEPRPQLLPVPPPPVVAKVAIPVACKVEQVPMPDYPGDLIRKGDDVYTLTRLAMADRRVRIAERDRLRAANANPCPEHSETSK